MLPSCLSLYIKQWMDAVEQNVFHSNSLVQKPKQGLRGFDQIARERRPKIEATNINILMGDKR